MRVAEEHGSKYTTLQAWRRGDRTPSGAAERAELPEDFRKHDLRHRRVTTWLSEGHSPVKVQKAMGHADLKTTMGYYSFVRSDLESPVEPDEAEWRELAELKR